MTIKQITARYNELAAKLNMNTVKKFRDKPTALARYEKVKAEYSKTMRNLARHGMKTSIRIGDRIVNRHIFSRKAGYIVVIDHVWYWVGQGSRDNFFVTVPINRTWGNRIPKARR